MAASTQPMSQSMSVPAAISANAIVPRRPLALALAQRTMQRAMPLVTASAGVALATLAAERTLATLALRAVERTGLRQSEGSALVPAAIGLTEPPIVRVTVTRTTVVERITRRG